jgi:hypothetical protein
MLVKERTPMLIRKTLTLIAISLFLAACGLGGGNDVRVEEFEITGSSPDLEEGNVPIDSSINDGNFLLRWKVDDDNAFGYTANFYLSVNNDISSNDINFATVVCGDFLHCDDDDRNDENCYFTNSLEMYCGDKNNNFKYEIDDLIDQLPEDLYIILEACNDLDCDTKAVSIRLR